MEAVDEAVGGFVRETVAHRAFSHPVFAHWAERKPGYATAGAVLRQIGEFCAATRPCGMIPAGLRELQLGTEARIVEEISTSEDGHTIAFQRMAGYLLRETDAEGGMRIEEDPRHIDRGLIWLSGAKLGSEPDFDRETGLLSETRALTSSIRSSRAILEEITVARNVGAMAVIEMLANRHIIPGMVAAFLDSGHYRARIEHSDMGYLAEHAGEDGAELQHETDILRVVAATLASRCGWAVFQGSRSLLPKIATFYDALDDALTRG